MAAFLRLPAILWSDVIRMWFLKSKIHQVQSKDSSQAGDLTVDISLTRIRPVHPQSWETEETLSVQFCMVQLYCGTEDSKVLLSHLQKCGHIYLYYILYYFTRVTLEVLNDDYVAGNIISALNMLLKVVCESGDSTWFPSNCLKVELGRKIACSERTFMG